MKAQSQASGNVTAVAAQPMSAHALLRDIAEERLTNGVGCATVTGMKTRANAGDAVADVVQPVPSAVVLSGVAGEWLASGVRCASMAGMNRQTGAQNTGGGGFLT